MFKNARLLTFVAAIMFAVASVFGQSAADKLYQQGLQLQKTMTVAAQNSAISKFTSAKKVYDSAAKKAQCDQAISVSRNIIANLKGGGGSTGGTKTVVKEKVVEKVVEVEPTLNVDHSEFSIDKGPRTLVVNVSTNQDNWEVVPVSCDDGTSFISVTKLGSNSFEIKVPANLGTTRIREQKVRVSSGALVKDVVVKQAGVPVKLESKDSFIKFKRNGGDKKTEIYCNGEYSYEENSGENWYVVSKPSWIEIAINQKKDGNSVVDKAKGAANAVKGWFTGKSNAEKDQSMIKSSITVTCMGMIPGTAEDTTGRKGDIVLRSGDATLIIKASQAGRNE